MAVKSKYGNRKITRDGETFDSIHEYSRFCELRLLERAGAIQNLQRQVKFVLIPAQYEFLGYTKTGKEKKKCIERECSYVADYVYTDSSGKTHVEDVKGYKDGGAYRIFVLKRKLMLYIHGIVVEEI